MRACLPCARAGGAVCNAMPALQVPAKTARQLSRNASGALQQVYGPAGRPQFAALESLVAVKGMDAARHRAPRALLRSAIAEPTARVVCLVQPRMASPSARPEILGAAQLLLLLALLLAQQPAAALTPTVACANRALERRLAGPRTRPGAGSISNLMAVRAPS